MAHRKQSRKWRSKMFRRMNRDRRRGIKRMDSYHLVKDSKTLVWYSYETPLDIFTRPKVVW